MNDDDILNIARLHMTIEDTESVVAFARALLAAASEAPSFDAWVPTDPVARAHADNSRDLALIQQGWAARESYAVGRARPKG